MVRHDGMLPRAARLALGQFFTPAPVADLALGLILPRDAAARRAMRVLDPACGDGVFLARAAVAGVGAAVGVELDPAAAAAAGRVAPEATVIRADLFDARLDRRLAALGPFDAVVGNPPYVRADRLDPAQRARIADRLRALDAVPAGAVDAILGRGDLAAACILRALALVRPGGPVVLVVSSALLDAAYAAALWTAVAHLGRVEALLEAPTERWFPDAAVNAMILVMRRAGEPQTSDVTDVTVARLRVTTAAAAARAPSLAELARVADVRRAAADQPARWAAALRAQPAWFDFEAAAGDALVPLGELATLRRGVTSGANDIFYLTRARAAELRLEPSLLFPLVRSPRDHGAAAPVAIDPDATPHVALVAPADRRALARHPRAAAYLAAHADRAGQPTLRGRTAWWSLPARPARLFLTKAYAARFAQRLAPRPVLADQRVYAIEPHADVPLDLLAAVLNATFTAFALESLGRASLGHGALEWTVADAATLPVLDPRRATRRTASALRAAFASLAARPTAELHHEQPRADRAALDRATAALATAALPPIWDALLASVDRRTRKRGTATPGAGSARARR